jgi:hypothetical protein
VARSQTSEFDFDRQKIQKTSQFPSVLCRKSALVVTILMLSVGDHGVLCSVAPWGDFAATRLHPLHNWKGR